LHADSQVYSKGTLDTWKTEVAAHCVGNPNMITMIKQGRTKAAFDRIPAMARALDVDPAYLMGLALEQAIEKSAAAAVIEVFGDPITENELVWVTAIREASGDSDPRLTSRSQAAINAMFGK